MHVTVEIPSLIEYFRAGLIALTPVAEQARIIWSGPDVYDSWESIERTLFTSIVTSVVSNAVPIPPHPLPQYGLTYPTYADLSFITEQGARLHGERLVFLGLTTTSEPFDTMCLLDVDTCFVPTGRIVELALAQAKPELAARVGSEVQHYSAIRYAE